MLFMFKVKYVEFIMMLVRLDLNLTVSLFHHKCEVSETVSTTTLATSRKYGSVQDTAPSPKEYVYLFKRECTRLVKHFRKEYDLEINSLFL